MSGHVQGGLHFEKVFQITPLDHCGKFWLENWNIVLPHESGWLWKRAGI